MTREEIEEAKNELSKLIFELGFEDNVDDKIYALNMAIKALSQEPCDKCVYSTKDGYCQYDDITETIPPLEPCDDAVNRKTIMEHYSTGEIAHCNHISRNNLLDFVEQLPSVTQKSDNKYRKEAKRWKNKWLKSQKSGKWITTRTFMHDGEYYCNRCKCDAPNNEKWDYCPNCGAKMESEV